MSSEPSGAPDDPPSTTEWRRGPYTITTDPDRIDHEAVHRFLADSYWAADRPPEVIDRSLERSLTFGPPDRYMIRRPTA